MKEIRGDMFAYLGRMRFRLFITTNGFIKNDGTAVMGRGNALRAVKVFAEECGMNLPELLGKSLKRKGNVVTRLDTQLYTFPVKRHWADKASITLIKESLAKFKEIVKEDKEEHVFILPRPGCGNGGLKWEKVKPLLKGLPDNVWIICSWDDPSWQSSQNSK